MSRFSFEIFLIISLGDLWGNPYLEIPFIETLAQVSSCEFCEISKKTFFTERLWVAASVTEVLIKVMWKVSIKFGKVAFAEIGKLFYPNILYVR